MSKISIFRFGVHDYSDVYIIFKGTSTIHRNTNAEGCNIQLLLKNLYHLIVNNTSPENAQDLDLIMTIYNLLQNSKNYPKISVILWNC